MSGTVVDAANRPLPGVELTLQTEKWKAAGDTVTSDGQGRFVFSGLPDGEYILSAEGAGFESVRYGEAPEVGWVSTLHVGGARGDKSIVFRIVPRGAIEGVVRDEFGDPMMNTGVFVVQSLWRDGKRTTAGVAMKTTDDRGRYRLGNLAPGTYSVCAGGGQNAVAPAAGPVDYATRASNRYYVRTCNRAFQLAPGKQVQVDLSPLATAVASLRGHIRNLPPQSGFSVFLEPEDNSANFGQNFNAFVNASAGTFTIQAVPPGRYRLRAQVYTNSGGTQKASVVYLPVEVGGSDIDDLDVTLDSPATVDVVIHGLTENQIEPSDVNVTLRGDIWTENRGPNTKKEAEAHFEDVPPGAYRLNTMTAEGSCIESVKLGGREMRGARFEVASGAALHLDVTVSKNCGSIRMRAMRDDAAVPGAKVVLLFNGTPKDPGELIEDFANDEGEMLFSGLPPGRYLLWAWAVHGKSATEGPVSLAAVEPQAVAVDVTPGEPVHVDVPLLADEDKDR